MLTILRIHVYFNLLVCECLSQRLQVLFVLTAFLLFYILQGLVWCLSCTQQFSPPCRCPSCGRCSSSLCCSVLELTVRFVQSFMRTLTINCFSSSWCTIGQRCCRRFTCFHGQFEKVCW